MEQYNTTKKSTLKLTGAKINNNTKGIDLVWAKKNGIVVVAPKTNTATATTKKK